MDRIAMLQEILDQSPDDAFARYGLATSNTRIQGRPTRRSRNSERC